MALITTVGGETSDSYVSVSEADRYFNTHYNSNKKLLWVALSGPQKEAVLKRACQQLETLKVLDNELGWGRLPAALTYDTNWEVSLSRSEAYQRLQFPRNVDLNSSYELFIPQEVKDAQCEQAVHLLAFDDAVIQTRQQGIVEEAVTAGPVKTYTKYAEGGAAPTYLSSMAIELMRPFLRPSGRLRRS